jgi:Peptidase family S41/N-terminal domain of Peptidase_S41 in eukaryotic IRBP
MSEKRKGRGSHRRAGQELPRAELRFARVPEKIYACLLRLYPTHFRETYGEDALQLFRDRSRHERGLLPSLRLWLDLLADLAVSIPGEYRHAQPAIIGASAQQRLDGTPSFHVLGDESPRCGALLFGGLLSLIALAIVPMFISYFGNPIQPPAAAQEPPRFSAPPEPKRQDATSVSSQAEAARLKPDAGERKRVIDGAIANLKQYYIDPDVGEKTADALLAHEKGGDYDAVTDAAAFADLLTRQMRDVSHDRHMMMVYSQVPTPDRAPGPPPEVLARYRKDMEQQNCTFEKVEILPHDIGYLKLNSFPDPSICQPTATAAMASLNRADAIIFDLRDNGGGSPRMVALIATYLFDHPTHLNDMYNRGANTREQSWTLPPVPGNRLANKPAFVLTSARTFSGAEEFSYDLKMLKRATLVGETTAGGAHLVSPHRIDDHFMIGVPSARSINPISKTDWEGTGVEPDVKVKAADALATAEKLAESKLRKK